MAEFKQVRLNPEVRGLLDDYKMNGESYSIAIARLFRENAILKESQDRLMKIAMRFPDAMSLPEVSHRTYFAVFEVLNMDGKSDADKVDYLKIYLRPSLEENARCVLSCLASIKEEHEEFSSILDDLHDWIINTFPY